MPEPLIADIRRFNRFYTRTIGLLNETLTRSDHTLTEARVLFELGSGETTAAKIADSLLLDPAYLARIVEKFRRTGLVEVAASADDRRRKTIRLTSQGQGVLSELQVSSERDMSALIAPLSGEDRARLAASMASIQTILSYTRSGKPAAAVFRLRPHEVGDVGWVIERQSRLYVEEYGWNGEFEAMVCEIGGAFLRNFRPGRDFCWVAEDTGGQRLGAVFLIGREDGDAQLRMLHVERAARGRGVGSALVRRCVEQAREVGYPRLLLWTNDILGEARRIYEKAGFKLVEEERHHSFGKDLVGQTWSLELVD